MRRLDPKIKEFDSIILKKFEEKKAEEIFKQIEEQGKSIKELPEDYLDFFGLKAKKDDDTLELREISNKTKKFGETLNEANLDSFEKVERMYRVGFYSGVGMIVAAVGLFIYNSVSGTSGESAVSGNILSAIFGGLGVADMLLMMYTPVRELQQSRGNISKLSALFNEWQYISAWTGKTYNVLHSKLKNNQKLEAKDEKILAEMRRQIELKSDITVKLAKLMAEITTQQKSKELKVTITASPDDPEINTEIKLEADVHGISASEVDKIKYLWSEESKAITIEDKDKRIAKFKHDKVGEFSITIVVKSGEKSGSATEKITIKPKITTKAEPEEVKKDNEVKLSVTVEGLSDEEKNKLKYKWEVLEKTGLTITDEDKAEAKVTPTEKEDLKFKVTITKDEKEFATKEITVKVTD